MERTGVFSDRREAGQLLSEVLKEFKGKIDTVVIGIPRGGVVVAYEVANRLGLPLDVVIVKKLGYPGNPELALGATSESTYYLNEDLSRSVSKEYIEEEVKIKQAEAHERVRELRGLRKAIDLKNKNVILIDDGIATGASMRMAIMVTRELKPAEIIVATPVAPPDTVKSLSNSADKVVALKQPVLFYAIGQFYRDFSEVSIQEVKKLLAERL